MQLRGLVIGCRLGLGFSCACSADSAASNPASIEPAAASLTATAVELPHLPFEPLGITGRDGGYSARIGGLSVWVFGDTFSMKAPPDGSLLSSTWSWTRDLVATDGAIGPFEQAPDSRAGCDPGGPPVQLIPYDSAGYEHAFNTLHACPAGTSGSACPCPAADDQCGDRFALWPGPVVTYDDNANVSRALMLYTELTTHPDDPYDYTIRGTSVARWDDPQKPVTRTFPTVFDSADPSLTAAALKYTAAGTEYLYVYTCEPKPSTLTAECRVGRAPFVRRAGSDALASILTRADWQFYAGGEPDAPSSWTSIAADGVVVLTASTTISIQPNEHLGALTAVYSQFATNDVYLQTAPRPEGPWSGHAEPPLFNAGPIVNGRFDYYGLAHSEFDAAANGGKPGAKIYITTSHPDPNDSFAMPMRLFEVTLRPH